MGSGISVQLFLCGDGRVRRKTGPQPFSYPVCGRFAYMLHALSGHYFGRF